MLLRFVTIHHSVSLESQADFLENLRGSSGPLEKEGRDVMGFAVGNLAWLMRKLRGMGGYIEKAAISLH